ncbi:UNVERIFIED_ORG: UTP--glucose-1-phosphate uridylyltransferase, partial [Rhodanobacter sp. FW104-R5]
MSKPLRKVVFPVAGLGTRFLPATKVVAKEMLPVLDKPLIQYAVDEAVDAGADTLVFVTNRYKHAIADYFDKAYELESKLHEKGKDELLALVQGTLPRHVRAIFVTQPEALGLGHAVLCAKPVVGDEPFGVVLPDDLIWNGQMGAGAGKGALRQMAELADAQQAGVIAVEEVPHDETDKYGIVDATPVDDRSALIRSMVEKPKPADAPSNLAVVGRYVLPGRIFQLLEQTTPGAGGEIQLTDAIDALLKERGKV